MVIGGSLLLALLFAFAWGNSLLRHAGVSRQIEMFHTDIDRIAQENRRLSEELKYLNSPQYSDKWAKEHEGLAQPGEKVLSIEFLEGEEGGFGSGNEEIIKREILLSRPHREQWKIFFFGEDSGTPL